MFLTSLTEREVEALILAMRYWRHRRDGGRRTDDLLTREESDLLLAKLGTGLLTSLSNHDGDPRHDSF